MAPLSETIAVIDKSGKIISTSKHLFDVFKEAREAYTERKEHFKSKRNAAIVEMQALRALQNYHIDGDNIDDDGPPYIAAPPHRSRARGSRYPFSLVRDRRYSYCEQDLPSATSQQRRSAYRPPETMTRRHTDNDPVVRDPNGRPRSSRSGSSEEPVDMDLAYGEYHPPSNVSQIENWKLDRLVGRAQLLLEEANCLHYSTTQAIAHLQKKPDAMAAVALTLAEISNIVNKMAPSALAGLKTAAPAVFSLLASPQFLIAAGVGLGVTIVMFGGYKIIKHIRSITKADATRDVPAPGIEPEMDEMIEFNPDYLNRVEAWRRGVADAEAASMGTSVDAEFITPSAAAMSGIDITTARMRRDPRFKFDDDVSQETSRRSHRIRRSHASRRSHSLPPSRVDVKSETYTKSKASTATTLKAKFKLFSKSGFRAYDKEKKATDKGNRSSRLRFMLSP